MKQELNNLIENCNNTLEDLEINYAYFLLISGNLFPNMSKGLYQNMENLKVEKEMYEGIQRSLETGVSVEVMQVFFKSIH